MSDFEHLICPRNGLPCRSLGYCAVEKQAQEAGEVSPTLRQEDSIDGLPDSVVAALAGYCSSQRLQSLGELNIAPASSLQEQLLAHVYIQRVAMRRDLSTIPALSV